MTFNQELIKKARKGEIAILNNEGVEKLKEVLKQIWPDDVEGNEGLTDLHKYEYYFSSPNKPKYWGRSREPNLPAYPVNYFFMTDTEYKVSNGNAETVVEEENLPKLEFIIHAEQTVQVAEDSWRRQRRTLKVYQDSTIREIWKWANESNVDLNSLSIHPLEIIK